MKLCLISAPTINEVTAVDELDRERRERVPLGVLCLASVLQGEGIGAEVWDLDRRFLRWLEERGEHRDFSESIAAALAEADSRIFGFSSICSSYPLTLRIATALKRLRPDARIVAGGPQASAAAEETLAAFPAVDVVVRGEGELVLPALARALEAEGDLHSLAGVVFRSPSGIVRTADSPLLANLDALPTPAFGALPYAKDFGFLPVEAGRGCPFSCTFCSTSRFFRRGFRTKSVPRLVAELVRLRDEFGVASFDLVQDNFTVSRCRVVEFCTALLSRRARISWSCSARTDCIDDDLIDLMRKAGCRGLFFGVESGSDRLQAIIRKGLDVGAARARIHHASRRRIESSVALIAGFHEETMEDLGQTVRFFLDTLRDDYAEPQLSLLAPLTGTPVHRQHAGSLIFDEVISDMAFQGLDLDARERELVAAHPEVFSSYYSVPTPGLDRRYVAELRLFLLHLRSPCRWLLVALDQIAGDPLELFSAWRAWRAARFGPAGDGGLAAYYAGPSFPLQLFAFVREELTRRYPAVAHVLLALVAHLESIMTGDEHESDTPPPRPHEGAATGRAVPLCAPGVCVVRLGIDLSQVVGYLRRRRALEKIPLRDTTVATQDRDERIEMVRLSPASAGLLALCDGTRDEAAVAEAFAGLGQFAPGVPGLEAGLVGLKLLKKDGLITITPRRIEGVPGGVGH